MLVQSLPRAEHFGGLITAEHKVLSEESESRNNHRCAVVVQDLAAQWIQSYPCKTKTFSSRVTGMTRIEILSDRGDGLFSSPWSGDASPQAGSPG